MKYKHYIKNNRLGEYYYNEKSFKDVTTIKIGGKIKLLFFPNSIDSFIIFYKYYLKYNDCKLIVIGNGSNILASSNDFNGIVVCFKNIKNINIVNNKVIVSSGVMIMELINYLKKYNLGGFEFFGYIPATIGGLVKMNGGCYNKTISDNLISIKCIKDDGSIIIYNKKEINFYYRKTNIEDIILECCFEIKKVNKEEIEKTLKIIKQERINKQPLNYYNAGSTFKNGSNYFVGELIDKLGLKGYSINDAMISEKHGNFLVNKKNCNSEDMIKLVNFVKEKVKNKYKIELDNEWNFINF